MKNILFPQQALKDAQEIVAIAQTELPLLKAKNEELHEALLKKNEELLAKEEALLVSTQQIEELQATIAIDGLGIQEPQ